MADVGGIGSGASEGSSTTGSSSVLGKVAAMFEKSINETLEANAQISAMQTQKNIAANKPQ